jgi:acyl-CoA thioesterase FadM
MIAAFSLERRVEFCDTDSAGIAHFSSVAVYMEQAEHALFRSLGMSVFPQQLSTTVISQHSLDTRPTDPLAVAPGGENGGDRIVDLVASQGEQEKSLDVTWPRVHISLDFLGPARFEDVLRIEVVVARLGESSVTFEHLIHGPKHPVARGTSISVCCKIDRSNSHELIKQPIPQLIRNKLTTYLRS